MEPVSSKLYELESEQDRKREDEVGRQQRLRAGGLGHGLPLVVVLPA